MLIRVVESNITWVASYPKSGNTMMRAFLCSYFFTKNGVLDNLNVLQSVSAFNSYQLLKTIDNCPKLATLLEHPEIISTYWKEMQRSIIKKNPSKNFFLKTHNAQIKFNLHNFTSKELTKAFVYIVRDPRSVLVSLKAHYGYKDFNESLKVIMSDKHISYATKEGRLPEFLLSWKKNFISWQNFNKNYLDLGILVKYEDLVTDPCKNFFIVLKFLLNKFKINFDKNKFNNSIESINFQNLKRLENNFGFSEKSKYSKNFFRSGKTTEWKDALTEDIIQSIEKSFEKEMKYLGYL